jgi:hypothetical protein
MAYSDWQDHDDHDDGGYSDHHDHTDSDCVYTDWVDHTDGGHTDHDDHQDGGAHSDWTDHNDSGDPHSDWSDGHVDWTDHDDVAHNDWTDAHSDWTDGHVDWTDHDDVVHDDWTDAHQDWTDGHSDWTNHSDVAHDDWTDAHQDWSDGHADWSQHDDYTDGIYNDWNDHIDSGDPHSDWTNIHVDGGPYEDWDDHNDSGAPHSDWTNAHVDIAHDDWDDHNDSGSPHQDWTNAHADGGAYEDWDDHNDSGAPHSDWTDAHSDYDDHDDSGAHVDWDDHDDSAHSDWSDHSDGGIASGKTRVSAWIDGKDVSCYIISADIWRDALNGIGRWELILDNQNHWWGGAFAVDDDITIHINGSLMMMGYVDDIAPYIDSKGEYTEFIKVNGRDYGMDLAQLYISSAPLWENRTADDIVDIALLMAGSEISYVTPSTAPVIDYEFDRTYLSDGIRDIAKLVDYDFYVQDDVNRTLHFFDIATMGGGVEHTAVNLTSVAGAATNNILRLEIGENVGFEVKNYVEAHAGDLNDHYTDLNAAAWTPPANVTITDDTVFFVSGKGAIRMTSTAPGTTMYMDLTFPRYNHTSLNMFEPNVGRYAAYPSYAAALNYPIRIRLRDTAGNWIEYYSITTPLTGQPPLHETTDNLRNIEWRYIEFAYGDGTQIIASALPLRHRSWKYIAPAVAFDWSQVDRIRFHAAPLILRANGDWCTIDELRIPAVEVISIQQDAASIAAYGTRMKDFYRPDIKSQVELDAYATNQLAKFKDPVESVKITAIGQTDSNYAAQSLDVQAPSSGIAALTPYRIFTLHHSVKLSPLQNEIAGYDYITVYELVKSAINGTDQPVDPTRISVTHSPTRSMMRTIREQQRASKTIRRIR